MGPRSSLEALARAMARHQLRPHVDRTFAIDQAPQAFPALASGEHLGKLVAKANGAWP